MSNMKVTTAVALALGSVSAAHAVIPTTAQCADTFIGNHLYVAGSSVIRDALFKDLTSAGGPFASRGAAYYKSSNGDFQILCGFDASNEMVAVHYRGEGGSVVGTLPLIAPQHQIRFLDLTGTGLPASVAYPAFATVPIAGTTAVSGTNDSWGPTNTTKHFVDVGITDVEPTQFTGANYPATYDHSVFGGGANSANFGSLTATALVDQVFGIFVNTSGINGGGTGQAINLTREAVAGILDGAYTDWSQIPGAAGGKVSTTSQVIHLVNREAGSSTRAQASIYFLDYGCSQSNRPIAETGASDAYSTANALIAANVPGGVTYASIENFGTRAPGLSLASINGIAPTNLAATGGQYDDWYEARIIRAANTTPPAAAIAIYLFMVNQLPAANFAPQSTQILATPNAGGNIAAAPVVGVGTTPIYINPYVRAGNSCSVPRGLL